MSRLTLTFDNGPTPGTTEHVLDVLATHGVKATFFVIGQKVISSPLAQRAVKRAKAEGHWIGNHTYTHSSPLGEIAEPNDAIREIEITQSILDELHLAHPDKLFRPYGRGGQIGPWLTSRATIEYLKRGAFTLVIWSVVPRDWEAPESWPDRAFADSVSSDWPLVVLHDIDRAALSRLADYIKECKARGYEFVQSFPDDCVIINRGAVADPARLAALSTSV